MHSASERLLQKPIEWVTAIKLERMYTKEEIIALYLNYFDFLHGAVGIKNAANTYFSKEPANLTINEAALLVGLCKNPSLFNPVRYPDRARPTAPNPWSCASTAPTTRTARRYISANSCDNT